jgi:hypothetical protein
MFKYRSKCRWNLLISINNTIVEISPDQEYISSHKIDSKYLELISGPVEEDKKIKKLKEKVDDYTINNSKA